MQSTRNRRKLLFCCFIWDSYFFFLHRFIVVDLKEQKKIIIILLVFFYHIHIGLSVQWREENPAYVRQWISLCVQIVAQVQKKIDGVSPINNRPSTEKLQHSVLKKRKRKKVKCDMWHGIRDMWHLTCETWYVAGGAGRWTFSQNFSSLVLTVW